MLKNIFNENLDNQIYMDYKYYLEKIDKIYKNFDYTTLENWNKILLYKCAKEYNKTQKDEKMKMKVVQYRGSTFIDWYEHINIKSSYKEYFSNIYLSLNINYNKYELRIRGKTKIYNGNIRNKLENKMFRK